MTRRGYRKLLQFLGVALFLATVAALIIGNFSLGGDYGVYYAGVVAVALYLAAFAVCLYYIFLTNHLKEFRIGWILLLIGAFLLSSLVFFLPAFWHFAMRDSGASANDALEQSRGATS